MELTIKPMQPEERLYAYQQSSQIRAQTGSIGYLRGDFGKTGTEFYTSWQDHIKSFRSDDFGDEFDKVVNALRFEDVGGGCLEAAMPCGFSARKTRTAPFRATTARNSVSVSTKGGTAS